MSNPTPDPVLVRAAQRMNARMAAAGARGAECATPELRMMASGFDVDGAHVNKLCALVSRAAVQQHLADEPDFAFSLVTQVIRRARAATETARQMALLDEAGYEDSDDDGVRECLPDQDCDTLTFRFNYADADLPAITRGMRLMPREEVEKVLVPTPGYTQWFPITSRTLSGTQGGYLRVYEIPDGPDRGYLAVDPRTRFAYFWSRPARRG